eukprot:GSChrysophyteH1.ASY1.ANO1.1206.1 assembled CDS
MSIELHRELPVFDKCLTVRQCQGASESRTTPLSFRVIPGNRSITGSSGQSERLFHFEVTDENDPYFLYVLDVGEQDFHLLKRDQALLVEFPVFPTKMVELLNLCLESEERESMNEDTEKTENEEDNQHHLDTRSSFIAKLDTANGVFSVIEMNEFKQLTHISLQMKQGNDASIKAYLASRLSLYMNRCASMSHEVASFSQKLEMEVSERVNVSKALEEIRSHKDVSEESLRSAHTNEIAKLQMSLVNQAEQARERYEGQLDGCRNEIDLLRAELKQSKLDAEEGMLALKREKQHLEFRERELSRLLETAETDRDRVFNECREISSAKREADDECGKLERELAKTGAKCEALKLQVQDREEMASTSRELQLAAEDARKLMEEKLDIYIADSENLREKIKEGSLEITRGNSVIKRLQVIRKQESLVQDLRQKAAELERSLLAQEDATKMAESQRIGAEQKMNECMERLEESTKIIASNKEVISYLNEEINKWQLGLRTGTEGIAIGSGLGVTETVEPSKWRNFDQNSVDNSAQMFSPDTTKDISYGGYHSQTANITTDKSDFYQRGLENLGLADTFDSNTASGGLENLEYYADVEAKVDFDRTARATSAGAGIKYAWQAEDFGLEDNSK